MQAGIRPVSGQGTTPARPCLFPSAFATTTTDAPLAMDMMGAFTHLLWTMTS